MSLAPGTRVGGYEVISLLGVGGMGEVYRARDPRLQREVALKILPEAFASDADRLARFQREAQLLAALNHPNIGGIHGIEDGPAGLDAARPGEAGPHMRALVLELVWGRRSPTGSHRRPSHSTKRCRSRGNCATRSTRRMNTASFIAI